MIRNPFLTTALLTALCGSALAQGTKLWTTDRFDQMEKGTSHGVALRSDGGIEDGPAVSLLYSSGSSYIWSVASAPDGDAYVGLGGLTAGSAQVMRVTPDGRSQKVFESRELAVQALRTTPDGTLFAVTSPDGKVYRIPPGATSGTAVFDPANQPDKPRYLWDLAVGLHGDLFIAAGAPAVVYRIPPGKERPEILFKTADQHIRCLLLAKDGTLWAGSDGAGVIYRISTLSPAARPMAVYAAPRREITSLAMDASGNLYAAGVGTKGTLPLPPLQVTGNPGVTITFSQPVSAASAGSNTLVPDGSELYRIAPDGTPEHLLTLKDDVVYSLAERNGKLFAATGNRGRIYLIDTSRPGRFTLAAHLDASQAMSFAAQQDGLLVATSNAGKLFRFTDAPSAQANYTSEVFDAGTFSRWGRPEIRTSGAVQLSVRTGNVENPLIGWSDWTSVAGHEESKIPAGRYAQWRVGLHPGGNVESVALNYLPRNIAPVVDQIVVQPGARVTAAQIQPPPPTVQVQFPAPSLTPIIVADPNLAPLTAQKDKTAITVRWSAHDDNGDDLMFSIWYRGEGESTWRLLKDRLTDRFLSFDTSALPDGTYRIKVVASDAPDHTDADAMTGDSVSDPFVIDTTPPVPGPLSATLIGQTVHATFEATDATSPIAHAEYSVDAGPWQYLEPLGNLSDSRTERYEFQAPVPARATEHVLAVRVYDRYENLTAVKTVVH